MDHRLDRSAGVSFRSLKDRGRITTSSSQVAEQSRDWSRLEQFLFDSVEVGKDRRYQAELSKDAVDKYLARLEELLKGMRESLNETPTLEEFMAELDRVLDGRSQGTLEEEAEGLIEGAEGPIQPYCALEARLGMPREDRPVTRSQSRVREEEWILGRALEHQRKGRPRQRRRSS